MKGAFALLIAVFLFVSLSVLYPSVRSEGPVGNTLYVGGSGSGNYTKIQDAVDNSSEGDTVYVYNGTYNENIVINKTINLIGENKDTTIINSQVNSTVLNITADLVNVNGFSIQNGNSYDNAGIEIHSNFCFLNNNNINQNWKGIKLLYSSNNIISDNTITNNVFISIYLEYSSGNNISNNTIINNNGEDIYLLGSNNNTISCNIIDYDYGGIELIDSSNNNFISGNTINNSEDGVHLGDSNNNTISANTIENNSGDGISLGLSNDNFIYGNNINDNGFGVSLGNSNNNTISSNTIENGNYTGIGCLDSNSNFIYNNTIENNSAGGISLLYFRFSNYNSSNMIYHNNLINNTQLNAQDSGINTWYNTTYNEGNYWSDYNGTDADGNGIGDTPYNISGGNNQDKFPLMTPFVAENTSEESAVYTWAVSLMLIVGTIIAVVFLIPIAYIWNKKTKRL